VLVVSDHIARILDEVGLEGKYICSIGVKSSHPHLHVRIILKACVLNFPS
jgi:hypothetical protein